MSIWSEATTDKNMVVVDGQLKQATVNQLVRKLTSEVESDVQFLKCFLMTYHSFMTPSRLLAKLVDRFDVPAHLMDEQGALRVKSRVVNVLKVGICWLCLLFLK